MPRGGHNRKPTQLKIVSGTYRPDRANPREPHLRVTRIGRPPDRLTPDQRESWRELALVVNAMRVAARSDLVAFESLVGWVTLQRQALASLYAGGNTSTVYARPGPGRERVLARRPELATISLAEERIAYYLGRFGMTPADRVRVAALEERKRPDGLDEFRE